MLYFCKFLIIISFAKQLVCLLCLCLSVPNTWVRRWGRAFMSLDYTFVQKMSSFFHPPKPTKRQSSLLVALDLVGEV